MVMAVTVLLVEDSPVATLLLRRAIESTGAVKIVGVARTGLEALALLPKVNPYAADGWLGPDAGGDGPSAQANFGD
jgi:two-component system chemotaxis response regulator CheB